MAEERSKREEGETRASELGRQLAEALNNNLLDKHGLEREDIFIITKLRPVDLGFDRQSVQL